MNRVVEPPPNRLRPRNVVATVVVAGLIVAVLLVPHPGPSRIRDWAHGAGPGVVVVFFLAHVLVCVLPFPRTAFTVAAGLLFGPALGISIAVVATTASAVLALLLVRALGRGAVAFRLTHPAARAVDRSLERRGWVAVGSLRLIAAAPFSVVNYCCGVSSVRLLPYVAATVVGILPGTVAVVLLGNTLTGPPSPAAALSTGACLLIGLSGLGWEVASGLRARRR